MRYASKTVLFDAAAAAVARLLKRQFLYLTSLRACSAATWCLKDAKIQQNKWNDIIYGGKGPGRKLKDSPPPASKNLGSKLTRPARG